MGNWIYTGIAGDILRGKSDLHTENPRDILGGNFKRIIRTFYVGTAEPSGILGRHLSRPSTTQGNDNNIMCISIHINIYRHIVTHTLKVKKRKRKIKERIRK